MSKIVVVTDSSPYIPASALGDLNIPIIPLWLLWDGQAYRDGVDIDPATFYQRLRRSKTFPSSSQPQPNEFVDFYREAAQEADTIVAVIVSSKISATYTNAVQAAEMLPELDIRVVDSLGATMGHGFVALAAARAAAAGKSPEEVVAAAEAMIPRVRFLFAVDTLEYLYRGGRIGTARHLFGSALQLKPILEWKDGIIQAHSSIRTKRKALARMLDIAEEMLAGHRMAEVAVVDVDKEDEGDMIADRVRERFNPLALHRGTVSPVVGTHAGPGSVGLTFYAEE